MKKLVSTKILKDFGLLIGFGFPIIIGAIIPFISGHGFRLWTLWIGVFSLLLAFIRPTLLLYPYHFWMKLGLILGWINSRLILGLVFIIVLIPISIIMKTIGYDPLKKNFNRSITSYRQCNNNKKINLNRIF